MVGGAVGAATGLFVFGTQIHSNTVNYDAPWRDQFRQMGKVQYLLEFSATKPLNFMYKFMIDKW